MPMPPPIRLVEGRGCVGRTALGRTAGLCLTCEFQGRGGEQMQPLAMRGPDGTTKCPNYQPVADGMPAKD